MDHERGRVVVGVDGSPESRGALVFALEDAARRKAAVEVVAAIAPSEFWVPFHGIPEVSIDEIRNAMHRHVKNTVSEVIESLQGELTDAPEVTIRTVTGSPAQSLLEAAEHADHLVVGSRGHGAFTGVLLGSVSLQCALHATCPITVVHGAERTTAKEPATAGATTTTAAPTPD